MHNKIILMVVGAIVMMVNAGFIISQTLQEQSGQADTAAAAAECTRRGGWELSMEATAYCEQKTSSAAYYFPSFT